MKEQFEITGINERGRGVGNGMSLPFTYPGDVVEAELSNKQKMTGRLLSIVTPSPLRQEAPCPHFGKCGGCPWQGLKYEAQLKLKEGTVRGLFGESAAIIPSKEEYGYRNRMDAFARFARLKLVNL